MRQFLAPGIVVALAAAWVLPGLSVPVDPPSQEQLSEYARIPVVNNGRVKPMDTIARTHLRIMSNKETFKDSAGASRRAIEWLMDVQVDRIDKDAHAAKHAVFRIDHPQLLNNLGLQPREGFRYSIDEFGSKIDGLIEAMQTAHRRKQENHPLDAYDTQLMEFQKHLVIYRSLAEFDMPHIVPPHAGKDWQTLKDVAPRAGDASDPYVESWRKILLAHVQHDTAGFNAAVGSYLAQLERERPDDVQRAAREVRFNHWDPFNKAKWLYLVAFVLTCLSWFGWNKPLTNAAWGLMAFVFVIHTAALVERMYLSGRPPVTNLYSSAIFIGWGTVLLSLVLERFSKIGVGNLVAAISGFTTLQIAHILSAEGDTMEVLQAVLDTQFWLATHVTCITLGYATTYVAGLLGLIFILRGVFTRSLTPEIGSTLTRMTYGTVCFATFFSFIGTVLGGLWADDSWGRFWGWDPKENGALMIVLWNALLLHVRWGGIARDRGIAMLAVFGNIVVSWSWFGVNQLGVGLHSYGFTNGVAVTLVVFAVSQLAAIGCAMTPTDRWKSALAQKGASAAAKADGGHV